MKHCERLASIPSTTPIPNCWWPGYASWPQPVWMLSSTISAVTLFAVRGALLAPGGTLVSYAIASVVKGNGSMVIPFIALLIRLAWWNALPNGHRATFYNVWAGHRRHPEVFRARVRQDLTTVLNLLADGVLTAHVAARLPLAQAREAMELAESGTVYGKVTLLP
jgi:NADPH:quinone reductase-like Zn-dependent oxidoreductase